MRPEVIEALRELNEKIQEEDPRLNQNTGNVSFWTNSMGLIVSVRPLGLDPAHEMIGHFQFLPAHPSEISRDELSDFQLRLTSTSDQTIDVEIVGGHRGRDYEFPVGDYKLEIVLPPE